MTVDSIFNPGRTPGLGYAGGNTVCVTCNFTMYCMYMYTCFLHSLEEVEVEVEEMMEVEMGMEIKEKEVE